jgi:hypothetical protein
MAAVDRSGQESQRKLQSGVDDVFHFSSFPAKASNHSGELVFRFIKAV